MTEGAGIAPAIGPAAVQVWLCARVGLADPATLRADATELQQQL